MDLDGTASTIQVLEGQTFYTTDPSMKYTGTMPNRGAIERELDAGESYIIPNGYHNGAGIIRAKDISSQTDGTAEEADLLYEKTAWVRGVKLTGTMPNIGAVSQTIDAGQTYTIPEGYHNGFGTISAKPNIPSYMVNDQGEIDPDGEQLVLVPNTNPSTYDDENEEIILP
jgi:hypothetical protein